jgi:S-formylglutathione hydrolase FrmB
VARLGLHNRHHVVVVAPTFGQAPWYGDHATDPRAQQERYFVQDVVPSVDRLLPTLATPAARLLLGFSKSGWGAFSLVLRHPETFGGAAAWDAPLLMEKLGRWETGETFGSEEPSALSTWLVSSASAERRWAQPGAWCSWATAGSPTTCAARTC